MPNLLHIETIPGTPVVTQNVRLLPFAQCVSFRLPVFNLGLVWNRPVSVLVTDANGRDQVLLVRDPTREVIWNFYVAAAGLFVVFALFHKLMRKGPE